MIITKETFYRQRGETYALHDPEASIRYNRALKWMDAQPGIVVREVGCKFAILYDSLKKSAIAYDYLGIDIDEATLKKIPDFSPHNFLVHDANQGLPFEDASVDYLFALEILEHLENPSSFLSNANRVLKPRGRLILSVPNPYCWIEIYSNLRRFNDNEGHIASFTWQNMDALTRFAGLRIIAYKGTYTRLPLTKRLFGRYKILPTDFLPLTRSHLYLIGK